MDAAAYRIDPNTSHLVRVVQVLGQIGIPVRAGDAAGGFSKGCRIDAGALIYDDTVSASTLLHEAGHIAICPGRFRALLNGDLEASNARILKQACVKNAEPDSPLLRAVIQMSDPEATAWAWAAGKAAGLDDEQIIEDGDYAGEGAEIRLCLRARQYLGINGLQHAGMTKARGPDAFPVMSRWLQIE